MYSEWRRCLLVLKPDNTCKDLYYKTTIVIPTLNEEKAIGSVLDELFSHGIPKDRILVVDGGSTDKTVEIARSKGVCVIFQEGRGKAMAIKTALKHVSTPYVLFMDGDYTYPAKYVCDLLKLLEQGYDHVIGARKWNKGSQGPVYRFGNWVLTKFFNILFGVDLSDVLSGMYAGKTEVLREIGFEMSHFSVESEIVTHMAMTGRKIAEIPIRYRKRLGDKKLGVLHGLGIAKDIVRLAWRYNPAYFIFMFGALFLVPGLILGGFVAYHYFFTGIKYYVKGIIAIILTVTGFTSLLMAIMAIYTKRVEIRTQRKLEELKTLLRELLREKQVDKKS